MIVFLICFVLYVLLSFSVTIERYGKKEGLKTLALSSALLTLSFVAFAIGRYINTGQINNAFSYFVLAFGLFNRLVAPRLWKNLDKNEQLALMRSTPIETWYFDAGSGYWFRREQIVTLYDWVAANNVGVGRFDLVTLKEYGKKYHWLWIEDDVEGPKPYSKHSAMFLGRMYEDHKLGPYSKHDNL